jgi:hypothetical protein
MMIRRLLFVCALALATFALVPVCATAQTSEEDGMYDETDEDLTISLSTQDVVAWRDEGEGLESGLALYLSEEKGKELYDITRLYVGEDLRVVVRGHEVYKFQIMDPIADNRLFMNMSNSNRQIVAGMLPTTPGTVPKTRVVK